MKQLIILVKNEIFYNNEYYVYLPLIKENYYKNKCKNINNNKCKNINKNKLINIFTFIKNLIIINFTFCFYFVLIKQNTNTFNNNRISSFCSLNLINVTHLLENIEYSLY